jgi:hypothetical protein
MVIKKDSEKEISISYSEAKSHLIIDKNGYIEFDTKNAKDENFEVSTPGEYEFAGVSMRAGELAKDTFVSRVNLLEIVTEEQIKASFIFQEIELDKSQISSLNNSDMLIVGFVTFEYLEMLMKSLSPQMLLIFNRIGDAGNSALVERLEKDFGKGNIQSGQKFSAKASDFAGEEDMPTQIFVLE